MLEQIQGTSEAGASEAVLESATVAETSEASAKMNQIPDLPSIIPTPLSPSNDSDHDELPLGQRMKMLPKPQQTTKQTPFRKNSLQQLLKVLKILKNQTHMTYLNVTHPQTCSL